MRAGIAFLLAISVAAALGQNASYTGCVTRGASGNITFCEPQNCSLLTGAGVGANLAGHTVTLKGTVKQAANGQPRTIVVSSVLSVGAACNQTCTLSSNSQSTATSNSSKPGGEGGTPGVTSPQ